MKYDIQTYDSIKSQGYNFSQTIYEQSEEHAILKALYEKNYLKSSGLSIIPHIIHQIWLGSTLPEEYKKWTTTWQKFHPTWEYRLWLDKDAEVFDLSPRARHHFDESRNYGQKSDILRHEILNRYGGLYVDTDFECLKPFDDLLYLKFFTSSGYNEYVELYPALIGCVPNNPVSQRYINDLPSMGTRNWKEMFETTGPYYYTRCFMKEVTKDTKGVVAFPPKFFYPWPNNKMSVPDRYSYVKSYSYAIHHWEVSWSRRNAVLRRLRSGIHTG
jgi:inositol phosphorylceramide mannosyltransferase catalytic subunit